MTMLAKKHDGAWVNKPYLIRNQATLYRPDEPLPPLKIKIEAHTSIKEDDIIVIKERLFEVFLYNHVNGEYFIERKA